MSHISDPHFAERVRASFELQNAMQLIQATMPVIEHGHTEIHLPHWTGVEQQHGFVHGGVVGMIADSAAGYAAMTVVPASASVLTVEYKVNLVAPGIRPAGAAVGDQKRIMTPARAIAAGADYLVVGRPVMEAADPKEAAEAIQAEIKQALG